MHLSRCRCRTHPENPGNTNHTVPSVFGRHPAMRDNTSARSHRDFQITDASEGPERPKHTYLTASNVTKVL